MANPTVNSMIQNAALLLILSIIYEVTYYIPESKRAVRPYINGIFVAAICIAIMMVPFRMDGGIVFDTRSILISITGFIFGVLPTVITAIVASIYRLYMGGLGAAPGVIVIVLSAVIGIFWRRDPLKLSKNHNWINILIMSFIVHIAMLMTMWLMLPESTNLQVVRAISLPVLTIYPAGSLILALLLGRQKELREYQNQLKLSEERYQALFDEAPLPYQSLDEDGYIFDINQQWLDMMGYDRKEDVLGTWFPDYLDLDGRTGFVERFTVFKEKGSIISELIMISKEGIPINVSIEGRINYDVDGSFKNTHCIVRDVTEKKKAEENLVYISYHDYLTGLFNRRYFEEELVRLDSEDNLPLSILMGDINGLKLINDTLGHSFGDNLITETSKILRKCMKEKYLLSRTGGDEFTVIMPNTDYSEARDLIKSLNEEIREHNNSRDDVINVNLSLGAATKERSDQSISEIIRDAEYNMYQRKLLEKKSSHSSIISSMQATMIEKSHETEAHARRLAAMARAIGEKMSLSQLELDQLELLSMLHDIGKVAVPDRILNKPDKLTPEEWIEMKKHPEIGYRIAASSPELSPIAEFILCHHERWDGKGYPHGLAGEEIPLLSRILSVVDAYDAMTENRAYRKAMEREKALDEIKDNSGTQFDPRIADVFINILLERGNN